MADVWAYMITHQCQKWSDCSRLCHRYRQHRLHQCKNMRVSRAHELFRLTELLGRVNLEHNISDHSMLAWDFQLSDNDYTDGGEFGTDFLRVLV